MSDRIELQLKEIVKRLDVYNDQLKDHMSRTALLEASLEAQYKHHEASLEAQYKHHDFRHEVLEQRIEKQETHINGLPVRILQFVSIISGIVVLLKNLL